MTSAFGSYVMSVVNVFPKNQLRNEETKLNYDNNKRKSLLPRQNGCHFADSIFKFILLNENCFHCDSNFSQICSQGSNWYSLALVQVMAENRDPSHHLNQWWSSIYASLSFGELFLLIWSKQKKTIMSFDIRRTIVGNKIVDHSDVVGASSVCAAPTTSSFLTQHLASMDWAKTTARWDETHLSLGIWCA